MYVILLSCVALILQFLPPVVPISSPGPLTREVGQDVVFMVNATKIVGVDWGIRDGNTNNLKQGLINYNIIDGMQLDKKINSTSYAGRVSFVGDMSKGQAWFKITNLNINDTNQYMAMIDEGAAGPQYVFVQLTVIQPVPTTRPLQTSTTTSTSVSVATKITPNPPRNITSTTLSFSGSSTSIPENQSKAGGTCTCTCTSIIAMCVTIIVILVVVIVVLLVYICKSKGNTASKRSLSSIKGEDLGAYENANQMDDSSNVRVHEAAKPKLVEKELYETICENRDEGDNTHPTHPGDGALATSKMTTRDPSASGQEPVPSMPQHYQELTNLSKNQQMPLYEPLNKRNTNHSTDVADNPRTYEQLQQNVTGREYQSLQMIPKKGESKV